MMISAGLLRLTTEGIKTNENHDTWATGNRRFYKEFRLNLCSGLAKISLTPCLGCFRMGKKENLDKNVLGMHKYIWLSMGLIQGHTFVLK